MRKVKAITLVYPADEKYETFFQARIKKLNQNQRLNLLVKGVKSNHLSKEQISNDILFFIGNKKNNPVLKNFDKLLPVQLSDQFFTFDEKEYHSKSAVFKLSPYPNPYNPSNPIYLITGNSDEELYNFLSNQYPEDWSRILWSSWSYEVFIDGEKILSGNLNEENWMLDKKIHFDFSDNVGTVFQTRHFRFISHQKYPDPVQIKEIADKCEMTYQKIVDFIGRKSTLGPISYHLYPSVEVKGLTRSNMHESVADFKNTRVDVVINEQFKGTELHNENKLLIRNMVGKPQLTALETGLSIRFTNCWQNMGYQYWAGRLYQSGNLPDLEELFDNELFERESPLVMGAMAGLFTDFLIQYFGKEKFLDQYRHWTSKDLLFIKNDWKQFLDNNLNGFPPELTGSKRSGSFNINTFLKGFNFAHEGYRVYNGYGSKLAQASLSKLHQIGTNAIAIVPYSFMQNPEKPSYIPIHNGAGGENDQAVLYAHFEAKKLGMHTMLKPQIWLGRSWPGDIEMKTNSDWEIFFDYYYRWVRHYALLAEINGFDSFCVGVEFAKATLAKQDEWRNIFRKVRGIFKGQLTYAANWGDEFENVSFWSELDFIGLNCYYPLSDKDNPSKKELKHNFNKILNKIETVSHQFNKPIVFTEIGFRSVEGSWKNPHADSQGRALNQSAQKICYEIILEGIQNKHWCQGILWWKWPSYLSYRGNNDPGFSPNFKQAESVVNKYFKTKLTKK